MRSPDRAAALIIAARPKGAGGAAGVKPGDDADSQRKAAVQSVLDAIKADDVDALDSALLDWFEATDDDSGDQSEPDEG